jgi:hypothetical protein
MGEFIRRHKVERYWRLLGRVTSGWNLTLGAHA